MLWLDNYMIYEMIPWWFKYPRGITQRYSNIIDYVLYAVLYSPVTI